MVDLHGATVLLSASFPSGRRGEQYRPYDASGIADAVSAFARTILASRGRLAFGGHPTITPLVLMISRELRVRESTMVFQSSWFEDQKLPEVDELEREKLGVVRWTTRGLDRDDSLRVMREEMIRSIPYAAALFVGGMEGIEDEFAILRRSYPGTPCVPVRGPGGAAAKLPPADGEALGLAALQMSRAYPLMALRFVDALAGSIREDRLREYPGIDAAK